MQCMRAENALRLRTQRGGCDDGAAWDVQRIARPEDHVDVRLAQLRHRQLRVVVLPLRRNGFVCRSARRSSRDGIGACVSYVFALGAHAVHQQRIRDGWFRPEPEACPARERDDHPTLVVIVRRESLGDPAGCEVQLGGGRPRQRRAEIVRERRDVRQPVDQATEHPGRSDPQALLYIRSADEGVLAPVRGRTVEAACSTSTTRETRAGWLRPSHSGCVRTLVGGGGAVVPLLARHPVHEPSAPAVLLL